ncbi:MAG TPA: response regulator transcription factor, partial [Bacteroidota bacterium]|nr:response regulator transcription factor [Bacteroidota bacterium]
MNKRVARPTPKPKQFPLVLADDHPLFRHGLRDVITADGHYAILGEAGDGERALELIQQLSPRLAVLDIDMPKKSGLEVAAEVRKRKLDTEIIVLTMHEDREHFEKALQAGVLGYVLKDSAAADIIACIEAVLIGKNYVSPSLSGHLVNANTAAKAGVDRRLGISDLTPTERKI